LELSQRVKNSGYNLWAYCVLWVQV
jgi:hypothetical protein